MDTIFEAGMLHLDQKPLKWYIGHAAAMAVFYHDLRSPKSFGRATWRTDFRHFQ